MSRFRKNVGRRILAFLLSGAMIMSNMTAFASEPSADTGGGYYEEAADAEGTNSEIADAEEAQADEIVNNEDYDTNADGNDDAKESSEEAAESIAVESTVEETESSEQETETSDKGQASETGSSLSAENEETESTQEDAVLKEDESTIESDIEIRFENQTSDDVRTIINDNDLTALASEGIIFEDITWHDTQHGLVTGTNPKIIFHLKEGTTADITIMVCTHYGTGANNTASITTNSGSVIPGTVSDNRLPITISEASGTVELTFASGQTYIPKLKVAYAKTKYTVTVTSDDASKGSASADKTQASEGDTVTLTAIPQNGYKLSGWEVTEDNVTVTNNKFTMPAANVTVNALWKEGASYDPSKPYVWDFGAESFENVNNMLTMDNRADIIAGWYADSEQAGLATTHTLKAGTYPADELGELKINLSQAGKGRLYLSVNDAIDIPYYGQDTNVTGYKGFLNVQASGQGSKYRFEIEAKAGDIITVHAPERSTGLTSGNSATITFCPQNNENDKQEGIVSYVDGKSSVDRLKFYVTEDGTYWIFSSAKLTVARIERESTNKVTATGSVTFKAEKDKPSDITDLKLVFKCNEIDESIDAAITESNGSYTYTAAGLRSQYSYKISTSDASYNICSADATKALTVDKNAADSISGPDIEIQKLSTAALSGKITGIDESLIDGLQIKLEPTGAETEYIPTVEINKTNKADVTYSATLEAGVAYTIKAEGEPVGGKGINDYKLDATVANNGETVGPFEAAATATRDIAYAKKPVYTITLNPKGATLKGLEDANAKITFTNLDEKGYECTFDIKENPSGDDAIQLRDGRYSIKVTSVYLQKITSNLKVNGKAETKEIAFEENVKVWDFSSTDFTNTVCNDTTGWNGLLFTGTSKDNKGWAKINNGSVKIPIDKDQSYKITVTYLYSANAKFDDETEYKIHTTDGSTSKTHDAYYTTTQGGSNEYVTISDDATVSDYNGTYLAKIRIEPAKEAVEYASVIQVGSDKKYKTINDALDAISKMDRKAEDGSTKRVTVEIDPGDYEEMLVIDTPNVTLKNASATPSIKLKNKGVDIDENAVRITSYYGHGYTYYSMGSDCKYDEELLEINKANGYPSFENPGAGSTNFWNATVVVSASGFAADGIIFENSFNQYISKKAADDIIVAQAGKAKEDSSKPRATMEAGDTTVQKKSYVERAAAFAITNNCQQISFDHCKFVGRQDTLYGGSNVTAAFYNCDILGGTDYICGPMTAVFAKCNLLINTDADAKDTAFVAAPQTKDDTRGFLLYNCIIDYAAAGEDNATVVDATHKRNQAYLGRPWVDSGNSANAPEAVFYKTILERADNGLSIICSEGWEVWDKNKPNGDKKSANMQEYGTMELVKGIDNSKWRVDWAGQLKGVSGEDDKVSVQFADGTVVTDETVISTFIGTEWKPFEGKNLDIVEREAEYDEPEKGFLVPLNANNLAVGTWEADHTEGDFTIHAGSAADNKQVSVDAFDAGEEGDTDTRVEVGNYKFSKRLKLGASGTEEYRSISFDASDYISGTLKIIAKSANGSEKRNLAVWKEGEKDAAIVQEIDCSAAKEYTFALPEAGKYYIAAVDKGVNIFRVAFFEGTVTPPPSGGEDNSVPATIWVVGDSTVSAFNDAYYIPRQGYGEQIGTYFNATVYNLAHSGASSKDFLTLAKDKTSNLNEYQALMQGGEFGGRQIPKLGDADTDGKFLIIGFGHNDEKAEKDRYTNPNGDYNTEGSFANSLYKNYIKPALDAGVTPVVATPIVRLSDENTEESYNSAKGHITSTSDEYEGGNYAKAIRDMCAALQTDGKDVILADLTAETLALNVALGDGAKWMHSFTAGQWENEETKDKIVARLSSIDQTHTNSYGAKMNAWLLGNLTKDTALGRHWRNKAQPSYDADFAETINADYVPVDYTAPTFEEMAGSEWPVYTDASGRKWYGSAFGDTGGQDKITANADGTGGIITKNFNAVIGDDNSITLSVKNNAGKFASNSDGFIFYYTRIKAGSDFTLKAKAKVNSFESNNQVSYGLMARDEVYINKYISGTMGDFVAAGTLNQGTYNGFGRKSTERHYGEKNITNKYITAGDTPALTLSGTADGFSLTYGENPTVSAGFDYPLTGVDLDYIYVGFFVGRNADITFSDISLTVEGGGDDPIGSKVAAPQADPANETAFASTGGTVTLTAAEGAEIYYTTSETKDGLKDPVPGAEGTTKYENAIPVTKEIYIRAVAVKDGEKSTYLNLHYTVLPEGADPNKQTLKQPEAVVTPAPNDGVIARDAQIALKAENGASIRYTTDGSIPTDSSTLYQNPLTAADIAVGDTVTIKAIAVKEDFNNSSAAEFVYKVAEAEEEKIPANPDDRDAKISVNSSKIQVKAANLVHNGKQQYAVSVTYKHTKDNVAYEEQLTQGLHYKVALVAGDDGASVGKHKLTITGTSADKGEEELVKTDLGIFVGKKTVEYEIIEKTSDQAKDKTKNIAKAKFALNKDDVKAAVYKGTYITPGIDDSKSDIKLKNADGTDNCIVVYKNNVNAGKASVTIIGTGEYFGSKTLTFNIKKADISTIKSIKTTYLDIDGNAGDKKRNATAKDSNPDALKYKGTAITFVNPVLKFNEDDKTALNPRTDYSITYKNNAKAGTATAAIKGINNLSGAINVSYTITAFENINKELIESCSSESKPINAEYSSKGARLTSIAIKDKDGKLITVLNENTDYKVNYKGCTNAQDIEIDKTIDTVTITGAGSYKNMFKDATVYIQAQKGKYHIKDGVIADTSKFMKNGTIDTKKLISTAKITDAAGVKIKDTEVKPIEKSAVTNTSITVEPSEEGKFEKTTLDNCHVAAKLSSVKQSKAALEKEFDGVNTVTLTTAEIAKVLGDGTVVTKDDIKIVSYKNNNKIGSATVTIEGKASSAFYGTATVKFKIVLPKADLGDGADDYTGAPEDPEEPKGTKKVLDVWDFAGGAIELDENGKPTKYLDEKKYNNMLTEDIMNSWYGEGVAPGASGVELSSFEVKNDAGEVIFEFNGNGKTNNRIRTKNVNITRKDSSTKKDADGNEYLGYVYSNSSSQPAIYLGMKLEEGDIVRAAVGSNGNDSLIKFVPYEGSAAAQSFEFKAGGANAQIATFYATEAGSYKMYSENEKLVVARVTVEHTESVTVSGKVTAPETLNTPYSIKFTCKETGAVKTAPVENGAYTISLKEGYSYDVALENANGYIITNENPSFALTEGMKTFPYDITVMGVDLVTVTGSVKGFAAVAGGVQNPLANMKLTFKSDKIYVPEFTVNEAGEFKLVLEKGVTYEVTADGVDDFTLETAAISSEEDKAADITFTAKPVYHVAITPEGVTAEELASTQFTFSRLNIENDVKVYEEDYVYTFTGIEGVSLRDGQYEMNAVNCPYTQKLTSDIKVNGADVAKTVKFSKEPATEWDFADAAFTDVTNYKGLLMSGVSKNKTYALSKENGEYKVPVTGPCKVTASYCYHATGSIGGSAEISLVEGTDEAYGSTTKTKSSSYEYTGEAGYVIINTTAETYMTKIEVKYTAEYKDKLTVGAAGCDYTTINDALAAAKKMDRPNGERVTIEIQPGDYEEMLVIDTPNVTLKNADDAASIKPIDKGVHIEASSVRITSYYGHGYAYYSMGSDCKWNADILAVNKENGCMSFENPGTGTTSGSYWNATVVVGADGFEADGIIFENSFNQYVSKKAADDVIVPLSGAKGESIAARNSLEAGDTKVQYKDYVERAAALAIKNGFQKISFNNCSFIGRQDTLFGGVGVTASFYGCDVYGGTDYIFGGMTAVFAKCDLVFNTNDQTDAGKKNDVGYITAAQQTSGRGYLMYNCRVTSTTPGVNTASEQTSKPGYFGRPWQANTAEVLFYRTIIEKTNYGETEASLISPAGWNDGLSGKSELSQEFASVELAGVDNSANRVDWSKVLTADADGKVTLADGSTAVTDDTVVKTFLGDWEPFAGKDMTIAGQ